MGFVLNLFGWEAGLGFLSQSQDDVKEKTNVIPDYFWNSIEIVLKFLGAQENLCDQIAIGIGFALALVKKGLEAARGFQGQQQSEVNQSNPGLDARLQFSFSYCTSLLGIALSLFHP